MKLSVPVIPAPAPGVPADAACVLCGSAAERRVWAVVGHVDTVICLDSLGCVLRAVGPVA